MSCRTQTAHGSVRSHCKQRLAQTQQAKVSLVPRSWRCSPCASAACTLHTARSERSGVSWCSAQLEAGQLTLVGCTPGAVDAGLVRCSIAELRERRRAELVCARVSALPLVHATSRAGFVRPLRSQSPAQPQTRNELHSESSSAAQPTRLLHQAALPPSSTVMDQQIDDLARVILARAAQSVSAWAQLRRSSGGRSLACFAGTGLIARSDSLSVSRTLDYHSPYCRSPTRLLTCRRGWYPWQWQEQSRVPAHRSAQRARRTE